MGTFHILTRTGNATRLLGGDSYEWALEGNADAIPTGKIPGTLIHMATAVTYASQVFDITTENTVEVGDLILLETPTAWTENSVTVALNVNGAGDVALTDRAEAFLNDDDISPETWYLITSNSSGTVWTVVTSLRGLTLARVRSLIADWAEEGNTDQIPAAKIPGLSSSSGRYFAIPSANVSGDADNFILSTGGGLTTLEHGDQFYFHPPEREQQFKIHH